MSSRRRGCVGLCAAALLCAGAVAALGEEVVERRVVVMGTSLDVSLVAGNRAEGLEASEAVVEEVRRIEDLLTTWRDSPLFRLNGAPVGEPAFIGEEIAAVLSEILRWASRTDRAFDPTVAPLMRVWDLRGKGRIPSSREIAAAVAATAPENFRIDVEHGRAARLHPAAGIDEGAWGKGYALDRAARRLADAGIANALLDLGGQTLALGHDSSAADWRIWIAHPRQRERPVVELSLSNLSASTSGNSERGRIVSGRRIGHELDPRSGEPAPDFGSATVVASFGAGRRHPLDGILRSRPREGARPLGEAPSRRRAAGGLVSDRSRSPPPGDRVTGFLKSRCLGRPHDRGRPDDPDTLREEAACSGI